MSRILKTILLPTAILAVGGLLALFLVTSREQLPRREQPADVPVVDVVPVQPGPVPVRIASRGMVTPQRAIDVVSEVSGKVVWADPGFLRGERVREGQLLLRIDPIDYEVALSDAEAALASAELSLAEVEVVERRAAIDEARARVRAATARLRQARVNLANTEIRVPFNAVVDSKQVDLGQYVTAGTPLMRLLATDLAEVRLPLLPADVAYARFGREEGGQWPVATLAAELGNVRQTWQARLARLEQRVDEQTRVFYLVAEVERPYDLTLHEHTLPIGLFVEADFAGEPVPDAVRLPRAAVHDGQFVFVVSDGVLKRRQVTLHRREGDTVIVGGLAAGERVVLDKREFMVDGSAVRVGN